MGELQRWPEDSSRGSPSFDGRNERETETLVISSKLVNGGPEETESSGDSGRDGRRERWRSNRVRT